MKTSICNPASMPDAHSSYYLFAYKCSGFIKEEYRKPQQFKTPQ